MELIDTLPLPPTSLPPTPGYRQPVEVTRYSHRSNRQLYSEDDGAMCYYRDPPLGADLSYGFERRKERDETENEHLDGICDVLEKTWSNRQDGEREGGIITWRGMITKIMTAPYETQEGWEMDCLPLCGSIYVEQYEPDEARGARLQQASRYADQSYMGYAFESYCTDAAQPHDLAPGEPEGWGGDVNTNVQWCNVVRSAIGDIPLLLGGEVDCVERTDNATRKRPQMKDWVELKTNKVIDSERADAIFHKKLLKHWAQSFLLGVPTIVVGFRQGSRLVGTHRFATATLPDLVSASPRPAWSPAPCLHFLHAVCSMLVNHVLPADPHPPGTWHRTDLPPAVVFRMRFTPRRGLQLFRLSESEVAKRYERTGRWGGVLPYGYTEWRINSFSETQNGDRGDYGESDDDEYQ